MKLAELLNNYKPMYPKSHDWDDTLTILLSDPTEKKIIDYLVNVLETKGKFREPVMLGIAEFDDDDVETLAVVNGTHRVCAYMIANFNEVYVADWDSLPAENYESCLSTEILFEKACPNETMDILFDALRSFPLNEEIWMEATVSSMNKNIIHLMWDNRLQDRFVQHAINSKVEEIVKLHCKKIEVKAKSFIEFY